MDFCKLEAIKFKFKEEINSKRALDSVNSIEQLILLLQKRLTANDLCLLKEIYVMNEVKNNPSTSLVEASKQFSIGNNQQVHMNIIYMYISDNLGNKWKDFARNIGVKEGFIDDLGRKGTSIKDNVFKILLHHQKYSDVIDWRQKLLLALESCRRKDMKNHVESILDRFKITQPC